VQEAVTTLWASAVLAAPPSPRVLATLTHALAAATTTLSAQVSSLGEG
jgi:hypothetical protein